MSGRKDNYEFAPVPTEPSVAERQADSRRWKKKLARAGAALSLLAAVGLIDCVNRQNPVEGARNILSSIANSPYSAFKGFSAPSAPEQPHQPRTESLDPANRVKGLSETIFDGWSKLVGSDSPQR